MENLNGKRRVRFIHFFKNHFTYTNYDRVDTGWKISYHISNDNYCCPVCGKPENHYMSDDKYSCGDYKTISEEELTKKINEFNETEYQYIEIY